MMVSETADILRRAGELIEGGDETRPFFALYAACVDPTRYGAAAAALIGVVGPACADRPPEQWVAALRAAAERAEGGS